MGCCHLQALPRLVSLLAELTALRLGPDPRLVLPAHDVGLEVALGGRDVMALGAVPTLVSLCHHDVGKGIVRAAAPQRMKAVFTAEYVIPISCKKNAGKN